MYLVDGGKQEKQMEKQGLRPPIISFCYKERVGQYLVFFMNVLLKDLGKRGQVDV
jgi:hypothetical protein